MDVKSIASGQEVRDKLDLEAPINNMNLTQQEKMLQEKIDSSILEPSVQQNKKPRVDTKEIIREFGVAPGGKPYFQEFKDDLSKMKAENEGNPA